MIRPAAGYAIAVTYPGSTIRKLLHAIAGRSAIGLDRQGFVSVEGGRIWYLWKGSARTGTPLLVLHGGPGATHDYLLPLAALAVERPVLFYDQLGSGNSDRPPHAWLWTIQRFVEELAALRSALRLREVHLLGQSWGAALAVEYLARLKPAGVRSLVLAAPYLSTQRWQLDAKRHVEDLPGKFRDAIVQAEREHEFGEAYDEAINEYYKRHLCRRTPWPTALLTTFEKMGKEVYNRMWGPSEATVTGVLRDNDSSVHLPALHLPILFTAGEHDEASPETVRYYQTLAPRSQIKIFEEASHCHHLEQPDEFIRTVAHFLRAADANTR